MQIVSFNRKARNATSICLIFIVLWAAAMAIFPIKPFWVDEWRLLSNLKFKNADQLWGGLDFTQQFPRVYLAILKWYTSSFNYSYFSLRSPAFVVSIANLLLLLHLSTLLFSQKSINRYLFIMILVSSQTFTDYLVQIKHYEMEIFASLVAFWQVVMVYKVATSLRFSTQAYMALCLSFLVIPYFSYTYPIAVAPVWIVAFLLGIRAVRSDLAPQLKRLSLIRLWFPILLSAFSIAVFYMIDVKQLMADEGMHTYWKYRMMGNGFNPLLIFVKFYQLFAEVGSGDLFQVVFGIVGVSSFVFTLYRFWKDRDIVTNGLMYWSRIYAVILVVMVIILFAVGKLPIGEPKFNAFTVPAIGLLIFFFLEEFLSNARFQKVSLGASAFLLFALYGNIVSTFINTFTGKEYAKRMLTYHTTEQNIKLAQDKKLPILITTGVAYPDEIWIYNPCLMSITSDWVLRTFPAYDAKQLVPVIALDKVGNARHVIDSMPNIYNSFLVGDGIDYKVIDR